MRTEPSTRSDEARRAARAAALEASGERRRIAVLEREWSRYKYAVLEHSARLYESIRALLKDKSGYPAAEFYRLIDLALATPSAPQAKANAAAHVWGYFKNVATDEEAEEYRGLMASFLDGETEIRILKRFLWRMAVARDVAYLIDSEYFADR